jgi:hypothetical protein
MAILTPLNLKEAIKHPDFPLSMQVSYAKDMFIKLWDSQEGVTPEQSMNICVNLIKQAIAGFLMDE